LIEKYGADGVRVGILLSSAAGNDLLFDEDLMLQGRNFATKIWNAYKLIQGWKRDENIKAKESDKQTIIGLENN
jgi:valyl-tRNA synthetase